eukprot:COSAG04_NODE_33225_length_166_cov_30.014925_1_plen_37_part_10
MSETEPEPEPEPEPASSQAGPSQQKEDGKRAWTSSSE